jgi:hypothetical protein
VAAFGCVQSSKSGRWESLPALRGAAMPRCS